jgi:hypothetical protein
LQCLEFCILVVLFCRLMSHFDAARTRWGVHWHMIRAEKSLVEILLLEFPQFRLKLVLQAIVSPVVRQILPTPNFTHLVNLNADIGWRGYRF